MTGRMIACLRRVRREGTLPVEFRAADARAACPRWSASRGTFLPRHCRGNPAHDSVHFVRLTRGLYRFIDDAR